MRPPMVKISKNTHFFVLFSSFNLKKSERIKRGVCAIICHCTKLGCAKNKNRMNLPCSFFFKTELLLKMTFDGNLWGLVSSLECCVKCAINIIARSPLKLNRLLVMMEMKLQHYINHQRSKTSVSIENQYRCRVAFRMHWKKSI